MAVSSGKIVTPRLPRLDSPQLHTESPYQVSPTDLRSSHYAVIPPVGGVKSRPDYYQDVPPQSEFSVEMPHLLPDIGEPHPCPYFLTPDVDLRPQKWSTAKLKDEEILKLATAQLLADEKFGTEVVGMLLMEIIEESYAEEIASEVLWELKNN